MNNDDAAQSGGEISSSGIGERIKALRRVRHLTQAELARRIGIRTGPMNALENGKHVPSGRVLYRLAEVLDASVDYILGLEVRGNRTDQAVNAPLYVAEPHASYGVAVASAWPVAAMAALNDDPALDDVTRAMVDQIIQSFLALEDLCGAQKRAHIPLYVPFARTAQGIEMWAQ